MGQDEQDPPHSGFRASSGAAMEPIDLTALPHAGNSSQFEGCRYGGVAVSLFFFDGPPGSGPRLHRHPYPELFLLQTGEATFVVGDAQFTAIAGQIVVAPAGIPHKFTNTGAGRITSIDIHLSDHFIIEWLEA
jgi:mannose-6-phosphate isomerase-like protein (cupin superfamily)